MGIWFTRQADNISLDYKIDLRLKDHFGIYHEGTIEGNESEINANKIKKVLNWQVGVLKVKCKVYDGGVGGCKPDDFKWTKGYDIPSFEVCSYARDQHRQGVARIIGN